MFNNRFHFIVLKLVTIIILSSPMKVLDKGILPLERISVGIQFFVDFENDDKINPCKVFTRPNKCCLYINNNNTDCDSVSLYGENVDTLEPSDRRTYLYVYPTLAQLNRQGYCRLSLLYRCGRRTPIESQDIRIPFDTQHKKRGSNRLLLKCFKGQALDQCRGADEDPLNNCRPVDCDVKYAGGKPFYDRNSSLCVEAPECLSSPDKSLPDRAYEPRSNTCRDLDHVLSVTDIYLLNSGLGQLDAPLYDEETKVVYRNNCSTVSQNIYFLKDMLLGRLGSMNRFKVDYTESCNNAIMSILSCVIGASTVLVSSVCCAAAVLWAVEQWKLGRLRGTVTDLRTRLVSGDACEPRESKVNRDLKNKLLKEVIVSDLPVELQHSLLDVCERAREGHWRRSVGASDTSTTSDLDVNERERLLK